MPARPGAGNAGDTDGQGGFAIAEGGPMSGKTVGIRGLAQVSVNAKELERAVAFYREALELPLIFEIPGAAFFDCAGVRLMVGLAERPEFDHPGSVLYYRVDDLESAFARVVERGGVAEGEPHLVGRMGAMEVWMGFLRDTEGNLLALTEERG
jgi:predicted enzyme related to lactoylglutathione lyase